MFERYHAHDMYKGNGLTGRQKKPYAHNVYNSPDGQYIFVSDLGPDKVIIYKYDNLSEKKSPADQAYIDMAKGAGPRHFTFHPNKTFCYVINELDCTVTVMDYTPNWQVYR
jgi:6-phosphogluconolactonase